MTAHYIPKPLDPDQGQLRADLQALCGVLEDIAGVCPESMAAKLQIDAAAQCIANAMATMIAFQNRTRIAAPHEYASGVPVVPVVGVIS